MTLSNPHADFHAVQRLAVQSVGWVAQRPDPRVLVVRDDAHANEFPRDTAYVHEVLLGAGLRADAIEEPPSGLTPAEVEGYDVIWFSNPGHPMDDLATHDLLLGLIDRGVGVILQGDDMAQASFDMADLTGLTFVDNGVSACGRALDNNLGELYTVTFPTNSSNHPVTDGLEGWTIQYGDDIDLSTVHGDGPRVLAWATVREPVPGCDGRRPVVVAWER